MVLTIAEFIDFHSKSKIAVIDYPVAPCLVLDCIGNGIQKT